MKVLAVSDRTWGELAVALAESEAGREVFARLCSEPVLPDPNELLVASTDETVTPAAFADAAERRDALVAATELAHRRVADLAVAAGAAGVPAGAVARWSGVTVRRLHQIRTRS
jgi:hypothetical protein